MTSSSKATVQRLSNVNRFQAQTELLAAQVFTCPPSLKQLVGRLPLADIAAMDAIEGRV